MKRDFYICPKQLARDEQLLERRSAPTEERFESWAVILPMLAVAIIALLMRAGVLS